jgi:hypothetical protein
MRSIIPGLASLCLLAAASHLAQAQPIEPPPARVGLELGVGLQAGKIFCTSEGSFCNGFTEAGGGNLNASYFLSPTLGLTVDLWAMAHTANGFTFTHFVNTAGLKWRPVPILTLQVGVGEAHASLDYANNAIGVTSGNGFAVMAGAAIDVIRSRRWALSVEARFGNGFYGDDNHDGKADVTGRNVGVGAAFTVVGF